MITYEMKRVLAEDDIDDAIHLYVEAFNELNDETPQNHLLDTDALLAMFADNRIRKYLCYNDSSQLIGMSAMTCFLDAHKSISEPYFRTHYPDEHARRAVWYILFVATDRHTSSLTFPGLIEQMLQPIKATRGIGALDYSSRVIAERNLPGISRLIIGRLAPLKDDIVAGYQEYHVYTFDW